AVSVVLGLSSGGLVFTTWFWSQLPLPSQPAVVQASLSVSVQGVLSCFGGFVHVPSCWLHTLSVHSLLSSQVGQSGIELDCCPVDVRLLSHLASFWDAR